MRFWPQILILSRFIEKARQDQASPYTLPAWDKDVLETKDERTKAWDGQVEVPDGQK